MSNTSIEPGAIASDGLERSSTVYRLRGHPHAIESTEPEAWGWWGVALIAGFVLAGLWLRLRGLAAEGFSDDEIHTWLISQRYLNLDFFGEEMEHPMITKGLVAIAFSLLPDGLAPELVTRLPTALMGGATIWAVAELGKTLFGREAGLLAAALAAFSPTYIGYQRIAREDVLVGLLLLLAVRFLAEARNAAAERRVADVGRWEIKAAVAVGAMFAAKYYFFFFPIPLLAWAWTRREAGWHISRRRWALLIGIVVATFAVLDFPIFAPSTWSYLWRWMGGENIGDRGTSESILFMGKLYANLGLQYRGATPPWFFGVFALVKFTIPTVIAAAVGLGVALVQRKPSHRIVLVWVGIWYLSFLITGAKYGRYFTSVAPAFFLLAAHGAVAVARALYSRLRQKARWTWRIPVSRFAIAACAILFVGTEATAAVRRAPHYRFYVNPLAGGDENVTWYFPHCDIFDTGFREAIVAVAAAAEPGAEVSSEAEWLARYYADRAGRSDLTTSTITERRGCKSGKPCYVVVQPGRVYWHNQSALAALGTRKPWHAEVVRGHEVATVYRLEAGEELFTHHIAGDPTIAPRSGQGDR